MKAHVGVILLACVATSVVASIPEIPTLNQEYFGFLGHPLPQRRALSLAQSIEILSNERATPRQTMLLINSAKDSGFIFKNIYSLDFDHLNEYPQDGADDEMVCYQEEIDDRTNVCSRLEALQDGSILYQNLRDLCADLAQKLTEFCADRMVELDDDWLY